MDLTGAANIYALLAALESHLHEGFAVPHSAVRIWSLPANGNLTALEPVSDALRAQVEASGIRLAGRSGTKTR